MSIGVQVTREGSGLSLPASLAGVSGVTTGDNVDWTDGGGAPGSIPDTGSLNFELKNEGGQSTIKAHGSMGSTETFDPTDGNVHTGTLNANCTFTLNAPTGSGSATLVLWLTEDSTGGWTVTWPGSVTEQGVHDTTLSTTQRVILETIDGGTSWIATWVGGTSSGTSLPWFIVTDYGATGNGTTDDTSSINSAIAALNTATKGVLYFPAGTYKVTSALTTITATGIVMGDSIEASKITCTSTTAVLFTLTGAGVTVRDLWLNNSATTSAGAAISVTSSGNLNRYENLLFHGWWVGLDIQAGVAWSASRLFMETINKYGLKVTGTGPDWSLAESGFSAITTSPDAAIYIAPSVGGDGGGGKIVNVKINGDPATGYGTGVDLVMPNSTATSILLISNCSIENVRGDAIRATTTGTGRYSHITITGCQVGLYSNNSGRAVKLTAATNGVFGANGSLGIVSIAGCVFTTDGTARAAIELTKTDRVWLTGIQLSGFNARYTSSSDTNTTDSVGTLTDHTHAATGSGSNGGGSTLTPGTLNLPTATSPAQTADGSVVWDSDDDKLTVGTGSGRKTMVNEGAATASGLTMATARLLGRTTASTGAIEEITVGTGLSMTAGALTATAGAQQHILLADGHATPFTFNDLLQMDDGSDFMWSDPE